MGSAFETWTDVTGPIFMGANSGWEVLWTLVCAGLLVVALIIGSRHELDAYKRAERNR